MAFTPVLLAMSSLPTFSGKLSTSNILSCSSYDCFDILADFMCQAHNREHWIDTGSGGEETSITHKQPLDTMDLSIGIGDRFSGISTHATRAHLMRGEHHHTIGSHTVPL